MYLGHSLILWKSSSHSFIEPSHSQYRGRSICSWFSGLFLSSWPVPFNLQFLQRQSPKGTSHYSIDCFQVCFSSVLNMIGIALCVHECCVLISHKTSRLRSHPKYSSCSWKKCSPRGRPTLLDFFPAGPGTRWLLILGNWDLQLQLTLK